MASGKILLESVLLNISIGWISFLLPSHHCQNIEGHCTK